MLKYPEWESRHNNEPDIIQTIKFFHRVSTKVRLSAPRISAVGRKQTVGRPKRNQCDPVRSSIRRESDGRGLTALN
jgi:hypothetical protein